MKQQETITLRDLIGLGITDLFPIGYNVYDINTEMSIYRIDHFMDCSVDTITPDSLFEPGTIAVYINGFDLYKTTEELKSFIESENKRFEDDFNKLKKLFSECDYINEE